MGFIGFLIGNAIVNRLGEATLAKTSAVMGSRQLLHDVLIETVKTK